MRKRKKQVKQTVRRRRDKEGSVPAPPPISKQLHFHPWPLGVLIREADAVTSGALVHRCVDVAGGDCNIRNSNLISSLDVLGSLGSCVCSTPCPLKARSIDPKMVTRMGTLLTDLLIPS